MQGMHSRAAGMAPAMESRGGIAPPQTWRWHVKVTQGEQEYYGWLFIHDLNLAHWAGYRDVALCTVIPLLPGQPPLESLGASVCQARP